MQLESPLEEYNTPMTKWVYFWKIIFFNIRNPLKQFTILTDQGKIIWFS